jgi:hypothetical protein
MTFLLPIFGEDTWHKRNFGLKERRSKTFLGFRACFGGDEF